MTMIERCKQLSNEVEEQGIKMEEQLNKMYDLNDEDGCLKIVNDIFRKYFFEKLNEEFFENTLNLNDFEFMDMDMSFRIKDKKCNDPEELKEYLENLYNLRDIKRKIRNL